MGCYMHFKRPSCTHGNGERTTGQEAGPVNREGDGKKGRGWASRGFEGRADSACEVDQAWIVQSRVKADSPVLGWVRKYSITSH